MRGVALFPGQGAQFVGMGGSLIQASPVARRVFEEADQVLDLPLRRLMAEGPLEDLTRTDHAQPAILTHSVAALRVLEDRGGTLTAAAGHSVGEYAAYVAAGSLSFADALRLVRRRGELMREAGERRPGTMAAVLGLSGETLAGICSGIEGIVVPANLNSPSQVVISGDVDAVARALEAATEAGAKRTIPLNVSGAFHSPLMEDAAVGLREALDSVEIEPARIPVIANASATSVGDPGAIRVSLARQLTSPVRWVECMQVLVADPGSPFLEIGPGAVLRGLLRSIHREATCLPVGEWEQLEAVIS